MSETVGQMLSRRRWCYWIPADGYVEGYGYRVSIVFEHKGGHYPTGDNDWNAREPGKQKPWFWGHDYEAARRCAENMNQQRLGLSAREAADLVTTSMAIKDNEDSL